MTTRSQRHGPLMGGWRDSTRADDSPHTDVPKRVTDADRAGTVYFQRWSSIGAGMIRNVHVLALDPIHAVELGRLRLAVVAGTLNLDACTLLVNRPALAMEMRDVLAMETGDEWTSRQREFARRDLERRR